ncbi:hypothetical protein BCR43DRAFT_509476 [Syncephalastrum racemosum]|uniref:Uncharacterized protein n=1 Tax=Syncephalastrum racemosum TaxID=13706 RepID=A0A1X2HRX8_SYNRA|nr:hypothetical protein BCR43DRAFT_509476 [Syncephalastrum racemosum]
MKAIKGHDLTDDTIAMYQSVLDALGREESPVEQALLQIDISEKKKTVEGYIMLKAVEHLLKTLNDWKQDGSEATVYRRIAAISDFMLRDTQVKLSYGETICNNTQKERQYNDIIFDSSSSDRQLFGRKIDLLIR